MLDSCMSELEGEAKTTDNVKYALTTNSASVGPALKKAFTLGTCTTTKGVIFAYTVGALDDKISNNKKNLKVMVGSCRSLLRE